MRKLLIHIGMLGAGTLLLGSATLGTAKAFETGIAVDAVARARAGIDALPPAAAPAPVPTAGLSVDPASLEPGEFVWQPDLASGGEVEIVVSVPLQRAFVYRGGTLIGVSTVSTGRRGHATPTGRFAIMEKHREHFSNLYNDAPMPFMQRLTMGGIALHAGAIPGRPASHGCVRLPLAFAGHLFGATKVGATVHVTDGAPAAEEALVGSNTVYAAISGPLADRQRAAN